MAADAQHKRWGELPPLITETESGIAAIEREQITKPRPVPIQGAALYQPGARSLHYQAERSAQEYGAIDPITVHTIALIQHAKKVQSCITNLQQQDRDIKPLEAEYLPPIPEGPSIPGLTSPGNSNRLEMKSEKKCSWKPPPQLGDHATRVILRRAVTAICAQAGFDTTWNSVLEVLTDVCSDIYRRICWQLRTVVDREALTGQTGFMDAMDHALHESGLEGLQSLVQFFDERIVGYNRHMLRTCRKLHQTYHKVKLPQSCSSDDTKNIKVKEEPVSEIHFPNLEEGDENMAEAEEVPMDELHRALQNLEGVPLKDDDASRWLAQQQQQQQQQQQPLTHHRKGSTASSAGHLDADEEIVIVSDSPPLSAEVSIGSLVDSVESGSLDATRLGRPPPFKKKKKT